MALKFSTVEQTVFDQGIKCFIYGDSGAGKTVLCATAPRPLIVTCESGLLSLKATNLVRLFGENNPSICYNAPTLEVKSIEDLIDALNWCNDPANHGYFDTVCIDSLTEIAETVLANAKTLVKDPRQAYGEVIDKMEMVVKGFRDIPNKNVVMLAKSEFSKDEITGIILQQPAMPGSKLGNKLPYFFDEVFRLGVESKQGTAPYRFLQTTKDFRNVAKDRSGCLDPIEYPHLGAIFNKIKGVSTNG